MVLMIVFIVMMILWLASSFGEWMGRYGGLLPWICVALLAMMTHVVHGV